MIRHVQVAVCLGVRVGVLCVAACMEGAPARPGLGMDITSGDDASGELDEGGEGGDAACVRDLPSCPDGGVPSYRNEVSAIVQAKCSTCHYPGNSSAPIALTTYAGLYGSRGADLDQVYACLMPTAAAPALTLTERTDLLTWFVCEAPDN